jgi:hypothetical protein
MLKYLIILTTLFLTACDTPNQGATSSGSTSGGAIANVLVGGLATGAGMAAGHHIINGAVNKWQERKAARATPTYHNNGGFNRMSRGSYRR